MKTIQSQPIWTNGKLENATVFQLSCDFDNLIDKAIFSFDLFKLIDNVLVQLISGTITMNQPDYETDWINNNAAWNWAATQLGLTITGEYNPA